MDMSGYLKGVMDVVRENGLSEDNVIKEIEHFYSIKRKTYATDKDESGSTGIKLIGETVDKKGQLR